VQTDCPTAQWLPDVPPISGAAPWLVEFRIGLRSHPCLADHGFHGMAVLPGAFHIALIRKIHRKFFLRDAVILRHIEFEKPVFLSDDDITLTVRIEEHDNGRVTYGLFEATGDHVRNSPAAQPCARLQVSKRSWAATFWSRRGAFRTPPGSGSTRPGRAGRSWLHSRQ